LNEEKPGAKQLFYYMKEKRILGILTAVLLVGILLMIFGENSDKANMEGDSFTENPYFEVQELEKRLAGLCGRIVGTSDVSVMITLEKGKEQLYAQNTEGAENMEFVKVSSGLVPTAERMPVVRGVAVVCPGGENASLQLQLTNLICALFGIPAGSVSIAGTAGAN